MKEIKLFWEGLWDISEQEAQLSIPETGGILMVIDARYTPNKIGFDTFTYRIIDLYETNNMYEAMLNASQVQSWRMQCPNRMLLKIARIENSIQRKEILEILAGDTKAPHNLTVINSGYKLPLDSYYSSMKVSAA
jgi:hypothetical protein